MLLEPLAKLLERDHNRLLGSGTTMRLAKGINQRRNRRPCRLRQRLHQHHLEELLEENGPRRRPAISIADGWARDDSRTLPHLEAMLEVGQQIIRERGGVKRGGGERSFFQQIITDELIARHPAILDFAASSDVLRTVIDYMKLIPALSVSKPLGVRLAESDVRFAEPDPKGYGESQLFHRDYHAQPMVYVIVALRDITARSGPFSFLPAEASRRAAEALRYGRRGVPYRITDQQMYAVADRRDLVEFICPAGAVLFIDSSLCFHYGSRDAVNPRYLMMYAYVPVCRADFGDVLRPECPEPVTDDLLARTRRTTYPIRPGDSRLRRLILDRRRLM